MPSDGKTKWSPQWEAVAGVEDLITLALAEDVGPGDVTTDVLVDPTATGTGKILAKEPLVAAGLPIAHRVFLRLDPDAEFCAHHQDGAMVEAGTVLATVSGNMRALLTAERTALNFLQRLSGVATCARHWAARAESLRIQVRDTRKTTPGFRVLEKYAVRVGGGKNHRMGLFDGVLIKDNHIAACGSIAKAVAKAREGLHHLLRVEVEAKTLSQVEEALSAGADVIMLDNMDDAMVAEAMEKISGRALVEVSGQVTPDRLAALSRLGVDFVSVGALTHSASAVDISMDIR
ncbi:MAG: carboxylating nicotinate-nucleotide diphosphorylase [Deltaproteobacteria bacterium]|nr:carboxylating nicotinate-nucleotide diphosphorylase [Deltaproteobacteria bacterium]